MRLFSLRYFVSCVIHFLKHHELTVAYILRFIWFQLGYWTQKYIWTNYIFQEYLNGSCHVKVESLKKIYIFNSLMSWVLRFGGGGLKEIKFDI